MKKILITSTDLMMVQFLLPHVVFLSENGYCVDIACSVVGNRLDEVKKRLDGYVNSIHVVRLQRSPLAISNVRGYFDMSRLINNSNYDIIWTNEPVMGVVTRLAARNARKKGTIVLYMVHGFHFYKGSSLFSWFFYYPIERVMSHYADYLVTINKEDEQRGKTFSFKEVFYIHGIGLNTGKFQNVEVDKKKKRDSIGVPNNSIMLLSVGELGARKNHEVVIRALGLLQNPRLHYVICGVGKLELYLKKLCSKLGIENNVHFLGYRRDIEELCKVSDIYVFPSQREGLGIGALEGMAAGLPLISSYINGIRDYTENEKTGYTLPPHDVEGFASSINTMVNNEDKRRVMGQYNSEVAKMFDEKNTTQEVYGILESIF